MGMSYIILREKPSFFQIFGSIIAFAGLRVFFLHCRIEVNGLASHLS
jgi:drug/metabolite transporter (DMT)-like permease